MYHMKRIINHNEEITLPKCMYSIKNPNASSNDEIDLINVNISNQGPKNKMAELEQRQEHLIKKLDILYDRIKTISSYCSLNNGDVKIKVKPPTSVPAPEEVVLVANPDNLPYYLNKILKDPSVSVYVSWHIHSSVPNEKVPKINAFVKSLKITDDKTKINLRLIFKGGSADSELKLSSLSIPLVGTVNILRYLSYAYPNIIPYDDGDYKIDSLLDICHLLEKTTEKNRDSLFKNLFSDSMEWVYKNEFTIVDIATYNFVKQSKSSIKYVPKPWFEKCEKAFS